MPPLDVEEVGAGHGDGGKLMAARLASSADSVIQHQHALIVYRPILVGLNAEIRKGAEPRPEGLSHSD